MKVLFIHENTLGHGSYLPQFVKYLEAHPELGVVPELFLATPLPPELARKADMTVPFLRRFGLDMHFSRWRKIVSAHVRKQVLSRPAKSFDAVVINTQSVALDLIDLPCPIFVSLDATFQQQASSRWFSEVALPKIAPRLVAALIKRERELFNRAVAVLPWSNLAAQSVFKDYEIPREKVHILPPSLEMPPHRKQPKHDLPRALFVGADFNRKGGDVLLESFKSFRGQLELDILTRSKVPSEAGVRLWRNIEAHTPEWESLWHDANFFIFPSQLETFGIVLVEAMAFELPVISSRAGAADEILDYGKAGYLLEATTADDLASCIDGVLSDFPTALKKARAGRKRAETEYELGRNTKRLAGLLHQYAG
jgi:glycosyltransferase involved in cell wall biosynthesis